MIRILRYPSVNCLFISLFSAFYSFIFIITAGHIEFQSILYYTHEGQKSKPFWGGLTAFLHEGNQKIFKYDMHMSYLSGIIGIGTVGVWVFAVVRRVSRSSGTGAYPGYCQR